MFSLIVSIALAQSDIPVPEVNAQLYRPPVDAERTLWTETSGKVRDQIDVAPRLAMHYAWRPMVYVVDNPGGDYQSGDVVRLVSDIVQADAIARIAYDRVRLAVDVPIFLYQAGDLTQNGAGIGDIGIDGRVTILDAEDAPVGLGVHARLELPTSTVPAPLGSPDVGAELWGSITHNVGERITLGGNLGASLSPRNTLENVTLDDAFVFRAGGSYLLAPSGGLSVDLAGRTSLSAPNNSAGVPVEGLLGGWVHASRNIAIRGGVGRGLTTGIGSPLLRVVSMISYQPRPVTERDLDGVVDRYDQCPDDPEDRDGFEDENGCPDPDNDGDLVLDVADSCPLVKEDLDGYKDSDGCPDVSQSIVIQVQTPEGKVLADAVTTIQGSQSGLQGTGFWIVDLHEGAYSVQGFAQGFSPATTRFEVPYAQERVVVVMQPAAATGTLTLRIRDENGKPLDATWTIDGLPGAPTNSGGIVSRLSPGTHELVVSHPGYATVRESADVPAKGNVDALVRMEPARVSVTETQIDIAGTVFFDTGSARILPESFSLLNEVADVLRDHPELLRVRVEGHTDSRGSASSNLRLSEERAASVATYLTERGVERGRLSSAGYGEDKPLVLEESPAAWEKNRRVDFFVEERR